jgi:hypothetical protein
VPQWLVIFVGLLLLSGGVLLGKCAYDSGVIEKYVTKAENKQLKRERTADTSLHTNKSADDAAARQRQKEIDDATKGIPDRAPGDRQRRIACVELLRQGNAPPECHAAG